MQVTSKRLIHTHSGLHMLQSKAAELNALDQRTQSLMIRLKHLWDVSIILVVSSRIPLRPIFQLGSVANNCQVVRLELL
jgi:hypothetical protein